MRGRREIACASHRGFLICSRQNIERFAEFAGIDVAKRIQNKGKKAFHICCTEPVELIVVFGKGEGITCPATIIKRHGICMPRQH